MMPMREMSMRELSRGWGLGAALILLLSGGAAWGQGQPLGPDPALEFEGRLGYAATADTLLSCGAPACGGFGGTNCDGLDGSTVTLDTFPESETLRVVHARLNWAATTASDDVPDGEVTLQAPEGQPFVVRADPELSETFVDGLAAGECNTLGFICPVQPNCDLGFYSNFADITEAVRAHRAAGNPLNGRWTLADVTIPGSDENDPRTGLAAVASLTLGAWSLLVVYEDEATQPVRRIYYYQGFELNSGVNRRVFPRGFEAPPPDPALDLTIMVLEGDQPIVGDQLLVNGRQVSDGCNPVNNIFNSTVNTGTADGRCRQGVQSTDLDRFTVLGAIEAGDDEAEIELVIPMGNIVAAGEQLFTNWMVLAFDHRLPDFEGLKPEKEAVPPTDSIVSPGGAISYRIQVENDGDGPALGVVVRDPLSEWVRYVPGSTILDGQPVPDGPDGAFPLENGLELTGLPQVGDTIEVGERHRLAFTAQVRRDAPNGVRIQNTATIEAELIDPLETETVLHIVAVPDGGLPPIDAGLDASLDPEPDPPRDGGADESVEPVRDRGPNMDRGSRTDGGPLLADADTSNPCGPGTRLNDEGFCVSVCGPGLRWDGTCDPGRCVHEDEPDCDDTGGGGSPGSGCACDATDGSTPVALAALLLLLGWRRRR